jgi:phospholipase/carboxylesterase
MVQTLGSLDQYGIIALIPESRSGGSWDIITGRAFGPDVAFLDRALSHAFDNCNVDPKRIAVGGFSDGASYALMMGLANGDLFSHILAFSPGYYVPVTRHGKARIFVSHGTADAVLNIDRTSRRIVPLLRETGYVVNYKEFDGPHRVPPEIARAAFEWFTA